MTSENRNAGQIFTQDRLAFFALIVFIVYTQYIQYVLISIPAMVTILGAVTICVSILGIIKYSKKDIFVNELYLFLLFFVVTLISGIIECQSLSCHLSEWFGSFVYFLLIPSIMYIADTKKGIHNITSFYALFSIVCAVTLIIRPVMYRETIYYDSMRYSLSTNLNVNMLGLFFTFGCWCILFLIGHKPKLKIIGYLCIAVLAYATIMTGSRKNLISLLMVLGLWFIMVWIPSNRHNFLVCIIGILILAGLGVYIYLNYYVGSSMSLRMADMLDGTDNSNKTRLNMMLQCVELFKQQPLFGWGFKGYSYYYYGNSAGYSHSTYAEVIACTGALGTGIYIFMYIYSVIRVIRMIRYAKLLKNPELVNTLKMALIIWVIILFLSVSMIFFYELMCFIIWGYLFSIIRYAEIEIEKYYPVSVKIVI